MLQSTLCQIDAGSSQIVYACIALLIGVLICFFTVTRVRRWFKKADESTPQTGFSLSELRKLQKEGKLSDQEFEKVKNLVAGAARREHLTPKDKPPADRAGGSSQ